MFIKNRGANTMNIQQAEILINRVQAMQSAPENTNNEWLFSWFTPKKDFHLSKDNAAEEMNKIWCKFRAYCKRNDIHYQGFRYITFGRTGSYPVLVTAFFSQKKSIEAISKALPLKLKNNGFQLITQTPSTNKGALQYIEKYLSKSHPQTALKFFDKNSNNRIANPLQ